MKTKTPARFCGKIPVLCLFLFFSFFSPAFPQVRAERPYWFILEQGKNLFRSGKYSEALTAFEGARGLRRDFYTRLEQDMINLLSIPDVRRLNDDLEWIERYIAEMHIVSARQALDEVYYHYGRDSSGGSASRIVELLRQMKDYPEAEYWIGETYRAEGELGIALSQYGKAWEQRSRLESPEFAREILYKIADIHRIRQEYPEMEARLLDIIAEDTLWAAEGDFVRTAMIHTLTNPRSENRINSFLVTYRYSNPAVLRAHQLLGYYYYATGRYDRAAEHFVFVFLIQNTMLLDEILRVDYNFVFTTLDDLLDRVVVRAELSRWLEENEFFRSIYYLGTSFFGDAKPQAARDFWIFLSRREEAGEFQTRARTQLVDPRTERAIERP